VNLFQDNRINIRSGILCKRLLLVAVGSHWVNFWPHT
jgi:hypothetical protein